MCIYYIMYKSVVLVNIFCMIIVLYIHIKNNMNNEKKNKLYYYKMYMSIMIYSIILLYTNIYIENFNINVQQIITGSPEF